MWFDGMGSLSAIEYEQTAIKAIEDAISYISSDFPTDENNEKINNLKHAIDLIKGNEIIEFPMVIKVSE